MNYKRAVRLLGIILVISIIIVTGYKIVDTVSSSKKIEEKLELSTDEKDSINYKHLVADIKAVESGGKPRYAKEIADNANNGNSVVNIAAEDSIIFYGDGYTIGKIRATDATIYEFYLKGRCTYISIVNEGKTTITKNTKDLLLLVILVIMACVEFTLYIKYKKQLKNNKIIEDKKSVWYNLLRTKDKVIERGKYTNELFKRI